MRARGSYDVIDFATVASCWIALPILLNALLTCVMWIQLLITCLYHSQATFWLVM